MAYIHVHVSETPDPAAIVECTWATGVELVRAYFGGAKPPATAAEREALRVAGGGSDYAGATYTMLQAGVKARYGVDLSLSLALPSTEIGEGTFLGVQGLYSQLPYRLQWPDRSFAATGTKSTHSAVVFKLGGQLLWCDPMVPWNSAWHGEAISWAEVVHYHSNLLGARVATVHLPAVIVPGVEMFPVVTYQPLPAPNPRRLAIAPGATVHGYDPAQPGKIVKAFTADATGSAADADAVVSVAWVNLGTAAAPTPRGSGFLHVTDGVLMGLLVVPSEVTLAPASPPATGDEKHTITIAVDGATKFSAQV